MGSWTALRLEHVSKEFTGLDGLNYLALDNISICIERGDFFCLLGPSGCGKSTVLNLLAGFDNATRGLVSLTIGGAGEGDQPRSPIDGPGTDRIMIFQDAAAALFPWLNVEENILFGPSLAGHGDTARQQLRRFLQMVGLSEHAGKFPFELSGGMKQRVQIARSLIMEPEVLLMDEPFAALDAITKRGLQRELSRIWQETGKTVVYVTHDIIEALLLGTKVAVMTSGPGSRVKTELLNELPHPRDSACPAFMEMVRRLEGEIREEVDGEPRKQ